VTIVGRARRRRRRQAGFSLPEVLIALGLASIVALGLLLLTRAQLQAFQQNDQINRAQQNARAGMSFVEQLLRRACSGASQGQVRIAVAGAAASIQPCVRHWDGAALSAGTFTGGNQTTAADAIEVIHGYGSLTAAVGTPSGTTITVKDTTGFAVNDLILLSDDVFTAAELHKVTAIAPSTFPTVNGTLTVDSAVVGGPPVLGTTMKVMRARSYAIYLSTSGVTAGSLMLDPDGMIGANHDDAEPLVEQVVDFQVAIGLDGDINGTVLEANPASNTDEWLGNHASDALFSASVPPWNSTGLPQPRQIRAGVLVRTSATFAGAGVQESALENRPAPTVAGSGQNPRWRPLRMVVAPRAWNLGE
jgi:prepilin-type N-terminal cleavage/methylation domain-containing protein